MRSTRLWLIGGFVCIAGLLVAGRMNSAPAADDKPAAVRWEYDAQTIELASVQAKLGELSLAGWEVTGFDAVESAVDTSNDNKPQLTVSKVMIISKRIVR